MTTEPQPVDTLRKDYRTALLRFLPQHDEAALVTGYSLGRRALDGEVSVLDIVRVHHQVLAELLASEPPDARHSLIEAAADFMTEVLAATHMTQRSITDH